jgi:fermentation-respiration switch protein FrsA (DUF1100 family)
MASEEVTPITARRDRSVAAIRVELEATGQARAPEGADLAEWRRLARRAARSLDRPVQTILTEDGTAAVAGLRDWPASPEEEAIHRAAMRRVVNAAAPSIGLQTR